MVRFSSAIERNRSSGNVCMNQCGSSRNWEPVAQFRKRGRNRFPGRTSNFVKRVSHDLFEISVKKKRGGKLVLSGPKSAQLVFRNKSEAEESPKEKGRGEGAGEHQE